MGKYIGFYNGIKLSAPLTFALTHSGRSKFLELGIDIERFFLDFSSNKYLIVIREEMKLMIFTQEGMLNCVKPYDQDILLIKSIQKNNLNSQNLVLALGTKFEVDRISVKITTDRPFLFFCNGEEYSSFDDLPEDNPYSINEMYDKAYRKEYKYNNNEERDVKILSDRINRKYNKMLDIAESYAEIFSQSDQKKANETKPIVYYDVKALEYQRIDRVEYVFYTREIDDENYKIGSQIQINDELPAEIIKIENNKDKFEITALFHNQIDRREILDIGLIHLSYTSTISDVQKGAIDNLRSGKTNAKNIKSILGGCGPEPYFETKRVENENFSPLLNEAQLEAIKKSINVEDMLLIMGPPGTGKTSVISELVRYFVCEKKLNVLVSSQNNTAIDNVMKHFTQDQSLIDSMIRIGTESRISSEIVPYIFENKVKAFRKKIGKSTYSALDTIENVIKILEEKQNKLKEVIKQYIELESKNDMFNKIIENELLPQYEKLENKYDNALKEIEKRDKTLKNIKALERNIILDNRNIFTRLAKNIRNIWFEKDEDKLVKLKKRIEIEIVNAEKSVEDYQNERSTYIFLYEKLLKEFEPLYFENTKFKSNRKKILTELMKKNNQEKEISRLYFSESATFEDINDIFTVEIERLDELRNVIAEWKDYTENTQNYAFGTLLMESVKLVGATCIGISSQKRFNSLNFDVAIIDEAGQIQLQNALVPMNVSKKTIMLGDYQQIPPIVDEEIEKNCRENGVDTQLLSMSLFEYLYKEFPDDNKVMLDTQYRMPSQVSDILSMFFYDGRYKTCEDKKNIPGRIGIWNKPCIIIDTSKETRRHEKNNSHYSNELEAKAIHYLVSKILKLEIYDVKEINIIAPYKEQVVLIKDQFERDKGGEALDEMANRVSTLDSYQGQENELIIYSFTRSSNIPANEKRIGFLRELRRLNVAMSRCKQNLILIGDMDYLSSCQYQDKDDEGESIYEGSEKEFGDFIKVLIEKVLKDGIFIEYDQVIKDLGD